MIDLSKATQEFNDLPENEKINMGNALKIIQKSNSLRLASDKDRMMWANGFSNGVEFMRQEIALNIDDMISFYNDDFNKTQSPIAQGHVIALSNLKNGLLSNLGVKKDELHSL